MVWCSIRAGTPTFIIAVEKHRNFNSTPCILRLFFNHALLMFVQMALWPRIQRVPGSIPEVKQPMRGVDHSPASSAEVIYRWSCNSAPLICLNRVDRNSFTYSREWAMNRSLSAGCPFLLFFVIVAPSRYLEANLRTHSAIITRGLRSMKECLIEILMNCCTDFSSYYFFETCRIWYVSKAASVV